MQKGDFGYFSKGTDGYIHYMQFINSRQKGGGGGRKPSQNGGCITAIVSVLGAMLILTVLLIC